MIDTTMLIPGTPYSFLLMLLICVISTLLIAFLGPKISDLSSETHIARKNKKIGLLSCLINCLEAIKESIERE